jgi:outer membrane protein assembly factor BamE (lipoprotein component of BamABCDE complex)
MLNHYLRLRFSSILLLSSLVWCTTACVTSGQEFKSDLSWINKGQTNKDQVKLMLGNPQFVGSSDGTPAWTYGFYKYRLFSPSYTKEVKFYWTPENTVESWSFNSSFPEDIKAVTPLPPRPASAVTR